MWARRWLLLGSPCNVQLGENGLVRQAMPEDVCARGEDQMVTANATRQFRRDSDVNSTALLGEEVNRV